MLKTLVSYLNAPRKSMPRQSISLVEYDAQMCEVEHRYGCDELLLLVDRNRGGRSLTNGVEQVLAHQVREGHLKAGMLVLYRDSDKQWDQIVINEQCGFVTFRPLRADNQGAAIHKVLMMEYVDER